MGVYKKTLTASSAAYVSKLLNRAHVRSAYWRKSKKTGERWVVQGTLVNAKKFNPSDLELLKPLLDVYNEDVRQLVWPTAVGSFADVMRDFNLA